MTIGEYIYDFVVNTLFANIVGNEWITANLDKIQGILTLGITIFIFFVALALVWALWRGITKIFTFWD